MISGYCLAHNEEPAVTFNLSLCHTTAGWERTERTDWGPGEILIGNLTLYKGNMFCYNTVHLYKIFFFLTFLFNLGYVSLLYEIYETTKNI